MTKKKFLADLDKRLFILDESERTDIINEYKDIIDEKIKHGTTEKDAISEFGDIDSLVEEILKAYKINPKYKSTDAKIKEAANKGEDFIKKAAKNLSEMTNDVIDEVKKSNLEISSENVFEIIIKVLLLLIGLAVLRIPFFLVGELGKTILANDIFPFMIFPYIWSFVVWVLYIIACVLIITVVFKDYLFREKTKQSDKTTIVKENKKKNTQLEIKEEIVIKEEIKTEKNDKLSNFFIIILQIFLVFIFFIPMIAFLGGWSVVLAIAIYLLVKGINTIGIIILTFGVFTISGFFINLMTSLFSTKPRINPTSLIAGFVLIIVGILFTVEMAVGIKYIDTLPNGFEQSKSTITYNSTANLEIEAENMKYETYASEDFNDGHIIVEIFYYPDYVTINRTEMNNKLELSIEDYEGSYPRELIKSVIDELEVEKIHNYTDLFRPVIKIYANSKTLNTIEINEE